MSDQSRYDEFHQNLEEFWADNGKLKSKKISAKLRTKTTEFLKALSTATTMAVAVAVMLLLHVTCSPENIQPHSADIHVQVFDWVDDNVYYVLQ